MPNPTFTELPAYLPISMLDSVKQLPAHQRLILFTRHSLREPADGNGFASYALPLTPEGRLLAQAWGHWLASHLEYGMEVDSLSSPIPRCLDTASLMQLGAGIERRVIPQNLLVEPGSLVFDVGEAGQIFRQIGALNFINRFLAHDIVGTKSPAQGILDLLQLFFDNQPQYGELRVVVSHDTLLMAFLAVITQTRQIHPSDWPEMMEGVFLWFDDKPFEKAQVHIIWRGKTYQYPVAQLLIA